MEMDSTRYIPVVGQGIGKLILHSILGVLSNEIEISLDNDVDFGVDRWSFALRLALLCRLRTCSFIGHR